MLHNTLSALLVSVASRYAKLSPSDVGIGIGGGHLVIDDVQLRTDTLNGPHAPFDVHYGRAGRLRVNVPWGALSSSPVQVYLENVHLIATPKKNQTYLQPSSSNTSSTNSSSSVSVNDRPWHQTNVGRLLFNVSIEVYGLKVEYRDDACVGVLSIASLRAFSAGPDWSLRFVSLVPDLDRDQPDASAVAMRKTVNLTGVHFVMIPRAKPVPTTTSINDNNDIDQQQHKATSEDVYNEQRFQKEPEEGKEKVDQQGKIATDIPDRNLDLESFESQNPILDGVSIALRVLLCTGATVLKDTGELTPGMHGEVFVEIDEPSVKLTARQILWLEDIMKQCLVDGNDEDSPKKVNITVGNDKKEYSTTNNNGGESKRPRSKDVEEKEVISAEVTAERNARSAPELRSLPTKGRGSLRSVWDVIVGENTDETVDDAAIALGLWNDLDQGTTSQSNGSNTNIKRRRQALYQQHDDDDDDEKEDLLIQTNDDEEEYDDDDDDGENDAGDDDLKYARRAVGAAAECGGGSWHVKLRTADTTAWDKVKELEKEISNIKESAKRAEEAEKSKIEAEERINIEQIEKDGLVQRNDALAKELKDLEEMTATAGRNKDGIIRELQSALSKAEVNLQVYQGQQQVQNEVMVDVDVDMDVGMAMERGVGENDGVVGTTVGPKEGRYEEGILEKEVIEKQLGYELQHLRRNEDGGGDAGQRPNEEEVDVEEEKEEEEEEEDTQQEVENKYEEGERANGPLENETTEQEEEDESVLEKQLHETGNPNEEKREQVVVVLGDDTGNMKIEGENDNEENGNQMENVSLDNSSKVMVVNDLAQNASLQSFFNNDDANKLEQRMGIEGLTLI